MDRRRAISREGVSNFVPGGGANFLHAGPRFDQTMRMLANNPQATRADADEGVLGRFDILPWTSQVAAAHALLRADPRRRGRSRGTLDMLIAAQRVSCL